MDAYEREREIMSDVLTTHRSPLTTHARSAPRISAVICTHNRADYLERALGSLTQQSLPVDEFEVLVVDNASTDATAEIARRFVDWLPTLRYLREDRLGLSWARNTGAASCRSPYLAYLDDDARAAPNWLERLLCIFERAERAPACIGGRVWLDWDGAAPAWLPPRYYSVYTHVDHGEEDRPLGDREYVVGANLAFRRDVLLGLGGFDTNLGRKGSVLLSGEESAVVGKIRACGLPIFYAGSAAVWHAVPPARRRRSWLWLRMFWDGASQPLIDSGTAHPRSHYLRQACFDLRRMARFTLNSFLAGIRGEREKRLESILTLVQRTGRLRTHLLLAAGRIR
jgi:glycosyltransferase involved in cell wall biosynthesis